MYTVAVKDHIMIAHSLTGEVFGPAQRTHGATYVITAQFKSKELDKDGVVIDIGRAQKVLAEVLDALRYQDLDSLPEFATVNTTTELLAKHIFEQIADRVRNSFAGSLRVVLEESHVAWGSYEDEI